MKYCESVFQTKRRPTREVKVGPVGVGGANPIRMQSMTTSCTRDVEATVEQILRLEQAGCEMVRLTVQGMKEALSCEKIKEALIRAGCALPLIADIHFYPPAAMQVVEFVDKVRINPGNFVDKRALFIQKDYDEASYLSELDKIQQIFSPLVEKCQKLGKAMRIGTNHGSLSDRIMNRYGDTPKGMVESALEFARIARRMGYHDLIFSMKASNPIVMIQAYRLLVSEMYELGWDYPLHLGVTEAGEGEDGRMKSAIGIGSLLLDGLGDTLRVSLTEDPWQEIDPCKKIVSWLDRDRPSGCKPFTEAGRNVQAIEKTRSIALPPLHKEGSIVCGVSKASWESEPAETFLSETGPGRPDIILVETHDLDLDTDVKAKRLIKEGIAVLDRSQVTFVLAHEESQWQSVVDTKPPFVIFSCPMGSLVHEGRRFSSFLRAHDCRVPVIIHFSGLDLSAEEALIHGALECGALLVDGIFDGIYLSVPVAISEKLQWSFSLMQAARRRTTKTEFISCPGCGRTLFDLQEVSKRIRDKTAHLPGVRIAIMGCIVNGPGEMADADFGYVGSRPGKIDLYVGKECVEKNIEFSEADQRLIALIQAHGKWVDPA